MVAVLSGARFAHAERLRADEVVRGIVGFKRMPSAMTLTRYFGGLVGDELQCGRETQSLALGPYEGCHLSKSC
jgi:hypothetical protein